MLNKLVTPLLSQMKIVKIKKVNLVIGQPFFIWWSQRGSNSRYEIHFSAYGSGLLAALYPLVDIFRIVENKLREPASTLRFITSAQVQTTYRIRQYYSAYSNLYTCFDIVQ